MKKIIMLTAILFVSASMILEAQIKKNRSMIGVSTSFSYMNFGSDLAGLGFSTVKYKGNSSDYVDPDITKVTTINFQPKFGYFVASNFVLGMNLSVGASISKPQSGGKNSMTSFGIGPFARYYISGTSVMPFLEINGLFGSMSEKYEYETTSNTSTSTLSSVGGGAGLAVKLGDKVTFDTMALYSTLSEKDKENNPNNNRAVQGTFGFKFGFVVLFGSN